jgi:hypothetical protein
MKRLLSTSALALFIYSNINGQVLPRNNDNFNDEILEKPVKKQYNIADGYWDDQNYDFALKIYQNIQTQVPTTAFLNFKIGECFSKGMLSKNNDSALHYLSESTQNVSKDIQFDVSDNTLESAPIFAYLEFAKLLRKNNKITEAEDNLKSFEESLGSDISDEWRKTLDRENKICETAKLLIANPVNINITNLVKVNSKYP